MSAATRSGPAWELTRHPYEVGLARLAGGVPVPRWALTDDVTNGFWSVTRTSDELSIICTYADIPGSVLSVGPFVPFSIDGPLDHSLVGVLAGLLAPIAAAEIPVMATSTYDTDWVLVPVPSVDVATEVWTAAGHTIDIATDPEGQ